MKKSELEKFKIYFEEMEGFNFQEIRKRLAAKRREMQRNKAQKKMDKQRDLVVERQIGDM